MAKSLVYMAVSEAKGILTIMERAKNGHEILLELERVFHF
jgi:hypothetical protein